MTVVPVVSVEHLDAAAGLAWAQRMVTEHHYRHAPVPGRASPEAWGVHVAGIGRVGCLIIGRPQATVCRPWYGSVEEAATGTVAVSRWCVLNLARVWLYPDVQRGGEWYGPDSLPGYTDRRGIWRSTLASEALHRLAEQVSAEYLYAHPPVYLDEPYDVRWLLSYCDTRQHRGVIYQAAGFELYRTNADGLQTWRLPLPPLTSAERARVVEASFWSPRAQGYRARRKAERAQLPLEVAAA